MKMVVAGLGVQMESLGFLCGFENKEPSQIADDQALLGLVPECGFAFRLGLAKGRFVRMFAVPRFMSREARDAEVALHRANIGI